jgi:hypothetical protein
VFRYLFILYIDSFLFYMHIGQPEVYTKHGYALSITIGGNLPSCRMILGAGRGYFRGGFDFSICPIFTFLSKLRYSFFLTSLTRNILVGILTVLALMAQ